MTKEAATPPLLKTRSKDPLESSWRKHMVRHMQLCPLFVAWPSYGLL
jgi:hypothetical protein